MSASKLDFRSAIHSAYRNLGAKKRKIADFVLDNPAQVISSSVQELAKLCSCEQTTIVRFAQQLGFSGYTDLKIAIARQTDSVWAEYDFTGDPASGDILNKLLSRHVSALQNTLASLDTEILNEICGILEKSSHVITFGAGTSQLAANDLQIKLLRLGVLSHNFPDMELTKTFMGSTGDRGIIFLFSHSGETESVITIAKLAQQENIPVAAVTSFPGSTLAQLSDYLLLTACRNEPQIRFGVMSARLAQLAVVDALTLLYSIRDRDRSWEHIARGYHDELK